MPGRHRCDEEPGVHGAQPPAPHQQLSVCGLPDLPSAHAHQVAPQHAQMSISLGFDLFDDDDDDDGDDGDGSCSSDKS